MTEGSIERKLAMAISAVRNYRTLSYLWTAALVLAIVIWAIPAFARGTPASFADLAEKLLPSVVNISTTRVAKKREGNRTPQFPPGSPLEDFFKDFFDRQQRPNAPKRRATSLGSGFIIDSKGLIVTNNHVIAEADEISVILHDDKKLKAKVVGRDAKTDLALLRVETDKPLPAVKFGNSDTTRVGDWVLAIGNPFGLGGSVSAGVVSAHHRNINAGPYDDFIQTDAPINRGNSGGPLFDLEGKVIGINTAIFSPTGGSVGIGFSIPSNLARPVIGQLKSFGRARRGWLGVHIQSVTDEIAQGLGLDRARGALVANLTKGGPAEKNNIKVGDVILKFNGRSVEEMRNLPRFVADTAVGKRVKVIVWRAGRETEVMVKLGEFPESDKVVMKTSKPGDNKAVTADTVSVLGLELVLITPALRQRFKLDEDTTGVVVINVDRDSIAAEKRVRPGDIVRNVGPNLEIVETPSQVKAWVSKAHKNKMKNIVFRFVRDGNPRFVALGIKKSDVGNKSDKSSG